MRHLKHHAMHLMMCAPMIVIAGLAIASGAGFGAVLPVIACMLMMAVMMSAMHSGGPREPDR